MTTAAPLRGGLIVANHGRHFVVEADGGTRVLCHSRGKRSEGVVGDRVHWLPSGDGGTIEQIEPRRNLFFRQDMQRTKSFAANLDQVLVLLAAEPAPSASQLSRALIAAEASGIDPLIVLNKRDLAGPFERAWDRLEPYRAMGYPVLPIGLRQPDPLEDQALGARLSGRSTLVLGPSGVGKSTLINRHVPQAEALTGEVSRALRSGRHTTTSTRWYWMDTAHRSALIDSPGFQEFGLRNLDAADLARYMPDLRAHSPYCRFHNCTHRQEPGCAVVAALEGHPSPGGDSAIAPDRYRIYLELFSELSQTRY